MATDKEIKRGRKREGERKRKRRRETPSKVSRLVTSVTEYQLAEKKKGKGSRSDVRSSRKSLCLSPAFLLVVIASHGLRCSRACKKKKQPEPHPATLFYKQKGGKKRLPASMGYHP